LLDARGIAEARAVGRGVPQVTIEHQVRVRRRVEQRLHPLQGLVEHGLASARALL
jgi:hypothetical protein